MFILRKWCRREMMDTHENWKEKCIWYLCGLRTHYVYINEGVCALDNGILKFERKI